MSNSFIEQIAPLVQKYPSKIFNSVTIAQACLESAFGQSDLARGGNNLFGIKASAPWTGPVFNKDSLEERSGVLKPENSDFRSYATIEDSIADHASFFESTEYRKSYYAKVLNATTPEEQARALTGTYATDSRYGDKLIKFINDYDLKQYDEAKPAVAPQVQGGYTTMPTILFVAGHGEKPDGNFDTGAIGYIARGEHKYMEDIFFPAIKNALPSGANVAFFSEHDCYTYGDIANQAAKYGSDTIVIECHYDAANSSSATGGHVIVYKGFDPDEYDIKLRDALAETIGVFPYNHKGYKGISGRDDLANANRTANSGTNWRLIELGFGTNPDDADYLVNHVDALAGAIVKHLLGSTSGSTGGSTAEKQPTGWISKIENGIKRWWFRNEDGSYKKSEWYEEYGNEYYFDEEGWAAQDCVKEIKGKKYHFKPNCVMSTGWVEIDGKWYHFNGRDGYMETKTMVEGKDGRLYYLTEDGSMLTNTDVKVAEDGSLIESTTGKPIGTM